MYDSKIEKLLRDFEKANKRMVIVIEFRKFN